MSDLNNGTDFMWIGRRKKCYWKQYDNKGRLHYYSQCKLNGTEYKVGSGMYLHSKKMTICQIHCLYENPNGKTSTTKYRAVVEKFHKPMDLKEKFGLLSVKLHDTLEIVKMHNLKTYDIPVESILHRLAIVFSCEYENPEDVLKEFTKKTIYQIFMCRYKFTKYKNNISFKSVLMDEAIVISDSETSSDDPEFNVLNSSLNLTGTENVYEVINIDENNLKLKLKKNEETEMEVENIQDVSTWSPIIKLQKLSLNILPSTPRVRTHLTQILEDEEPRRQSPRLRKPHSYVLCDSSSDENIPKKTKPNISSEKKQRKKTETSTCDFETPKKSIPKTPRTGRVKIGTLTPSIQTRLNTVVSENSPFEKAKAQLHDAMLPGSLPCREQEFSDILKFIKGKLKDQAGGCMYISGVPGTGKTATVFQVMDVLQHTRNLSDFVFIKLNALALTEPRQIYVQIVKQISGKFLHWEAALNFIVDFFTKKKKHTSHIMLVDELDKLCTRKQDVVYNLLDLPSRCKTSLIVITIANTMDLPERLLANKVNSRLGFTRLTFKPYKHKELVEIVKARLSSVEQTFKSEAIEFVARKVAAVSGDARRALAICTRSLEISESLNEPQVTMNIVDKALTEMSSSSKVQAIKRCSKMEKYILSAISNEVSRTGNEEVSFTGMFSILKSLLILDSIEVPTIKVALQLCHKLGSYRLIITQHGMADVDLTLLLNVSSDDIHFAL